MNSVLTEGTFRDPQGRLYQDGDRILRFVHPDSAESVLRWLESPLAQRWVRERRMVSSRVVASGDGRPALLEHERIFFPTYPWEWTPGQWIHAANLTLSLCEEAVDEGLILKDATPLNVLFSGTQAVFVDVLSFEQRDPHSPLWIAYAQFVRTFLLPLCAHRYLGWPLSTSLNRRDGYEPRDLAPYISGLTRWRQPFRSLITIPALFENNTGLARRRPQVSEAVSTFALHNLMQSARKLLKSLEPSQRTSRWSRYQETAFHYSEHGSNAKREFVQNTLHQIRPAHVLDVGANTGTYSRIAAKSGARVVAWDSDVQASDENWRSAAKAGLSILPVIADFARPTPPVGWQNREYSSLLDRSAGRFDCVLMLGIVHHLLIADQIPLPAVIDQLAEITKQWLIIEWIPKGDGQFDELCRGRDGLYAHLTEEFFKNILSTRFAISNACTLSNGRTLLLVEKHS